MSLLTLIAVLGVCFLAYVLIGDLFHHLPGARHDPEAAHRRNRPTGAQDAPADRYGMDGTGSVYLDDDPRRVND